MKSDEEPRVPPDKGTVTFRSREQKKNLIFTISLVAAVGLVAVGLFLFFTQRNTIGAKGERETASSQIGETQSQAQKPFLSASTHAVEQLEDPLLVLVNKYNKMPDDYAGELITAYDMTMDSRIKKPFEEMYNAAAKDGVILWISSAYRASSLQDKLFQQEINQNLSSGMTSEAAVSAAEEAVAKGGYSEHNTGLAIDLNGVSERFADTKQGQWVAAHAEEYGFVLRYPKGKEVATGFMYEPWHFRYVGKENALEMKKLGLCLEEYVDYIHQNQQNAPNSSQ